MPRPSTHTDRRLLEAGRKMLVKHGIREVSLRQVAEAAGVNLGMFHYHFKTKDEFIRLVLQECYEEFFARLEEEAHRESAERSSHERLRRLLEVLATYVCEHRELVSLLIKEVLSGNRLVLQFVAKNVPRHGKLMLNAIQDALKEGAIRKDLSAFQVAMLCLSNIGSAALISGTLERLKPAFLKPFLKTDSYAQDIFEKRVDFIMRGLRP
ncbi:MAG: TetR/AcrR family transcriptional regulator [Bacteriovoracia bacterium]